MYKQSSFRPNQTGLLRQRVGYEVGGRPKFSAPKKVGLSVIKFETNTGKSSIRADTSGSKSRAGEEANDGRILVDIRAIFEVGDVIEINKIMWKIDKKTPRYDQAGRPHHYQVDLSSWG